MAFDMSRCPQNEQEARVWFYNGIGRTMGSDAAGWETVMTGCGFPPGYGPNVVPTALMPFFAFTQQFSGGPKGWIFLPTSKPDDLGYYTRCIQYLDDAAGTYSKQASAAAKSKKPLPELKSTSGLVWSWYWVAGHEYDPVQDETGSAPSPTPPSGGLTEEDVMRLIHEHTIAYGSKIALRSHSGHILGLKDGGPPKTDETVVWLTKEEIHAWESFTVEKGE